MLTSAVPCLSCALVNGNATWKVPHACFRCALLQLCFRSIVCMCFRSIFHRFSLPLLWAVLSKCSKTTKVCTVSNFSSLAWIQEKTCFRSRSRSYLAQCRSSHCVLCSSLRHQWLGINPYREIEHLILRIVAEKFERHWHLRALFAAGRSGILCALHFCVSGWRYCPL